MNKRKKVGVIVAMEVEMESIRAAMEAPRKTSIAGMDFYEGKVDGIFVIAARCGVGKVCAAMCAQTMILKYSPDEIIGAGIAGALKGLAIGGVAIADRLYQYDYDVRAFGYPAGYIPAVKQAALGCTDSIRDALIKTAQGLLMPYATGAIVSGDSFISSDAQKEKILQDFPDAIACEMEGAAIAQVCVLNQTPFCVIRCISDNGDASSKEDYPANERAASHGSAAMVLNYIRSVAGNGLQE